MERSKTIISIVVGLAGLLIIWKVGFAPLEPIQTEQPQQQVATDTAPTANQTEPAPTTERRPQRGGMRGGMFDPNMTAIVADANGTQRDMRSGRRGMGMQQPFGGMMSQATPTSDPNELVQVNLSSVDIRMIIQILTSWTGKSIIPTNGAENVRLTVFGAQQMMPKSKALELVYKALRVQGYVAEDDGDTIFIKPVSQTAKINSAPIIDADTPLATIQDREAVVQKFFRLKNTAPTQIAQILYQLLGDSCFISADDSTSTLLVIDTVRTLMRAELLINKFDIDMAETFTEIFEIRHRDPEEIIELLETLISYSSSSSMMNPMSMFGNMPTITIGGTQSRTSTNRTDRTRTDSRGARGNNRGSSSTPTIRMPGMTMGGATSVSVQTVQSQPLLIAETRNKWVIARATEKDMELIRYWINKLDTPVNIVWDVQDLIAIENKNQIVQYFFQLEYYSPEQMLNIIEPMLGDSGYASAEENTSTLMVIDTVENLLNFQGIIDRFDNPQGEDNAHAIFEVKNGGDPTEIVQLIKILMGEEAANSRTITGRTTGRTTTTNRNINIRTR